VLLAWAMNGQLLPAAHGAPVRVVVPSHIGARSVKWVQRITARQHPSANYFQATAYRLLPAEADPSTTGPGVGLSLGPVAPNAEILRPDDAATMPIGPAEVAGLRLRRRGPGIARVDVSLDGGRSRVQADLDEQVSPWTWRHWRSTVDRPGGVEITARAWDTSAAARATGALWNPKGYVCYVNNSWCRAASTSPTVEPAGRVRRTGPERSRATGRGDGAHRDRGRCVGAGLTLMLHLVQHLAYRYTERPSSPARHARTCRRPPTGGIFQTGKRPMTLSWLCWASVRASRL